MDKILNIVNTSLLLLGLLLYIPSYGASEYHFKHIKVDDGLGSNTVYCLMQDSEGFMWFGTNDGLSRYDGVQVKTYRNDGSKEGSIGNNIIYGLCEDSQKRIYAGTEKGCWIFNKITGRFEPARIPGNENLDIRKLCHDREGNVWIATIGDGLYKYNHNSGTYINYRSNDDNKGITSNAIASVICDDRGIIWCISAGKNLYKYDKESGDFHSFLIQDWENKSDILQAFCLEADHLGNIWIGGWENALFEFDRETEQFTNHLKQYSAYQVKGRIHCITETSAGTISFGNDHGFSTLNTQTGELLSTRHNPYKTKSLSDNFVYGIVKDREGGMWVSTYFGGVNYACPTNSLFSFGTTDPNGHRGRVISRICEDPDGCVWIGTDDGGLFKYRWDTDSCIPELIDKDINNLNIHAILAERDHLWVGTYYNGLYRKNKRNGKIDRWISFSDDISKRESIYSIHKDMHGRIWLGTKRGIFRMENNNLIKEICLLGENSDVVEIKGDNQGNIYFASLGKGLLKYSSRTDSTVNVNSGLNAGDLIPDKILSIEINNDIVWVGTGGKGLFKYDPKTGKAWQISDNRFLTNDLSIYNIILENENLWMTTNKGLIKYGIMAGNVMTYNVDDGLYADIFNNNSGILSTEGYIMIGTNGGFNYFSPVELIRNEVAPKVAISDVHVGNGSVDATLDAVSNGKLTARTDNRMINIGLSVLSFNSPKKNRIRWKLEGPKNIDNLTNQWNENPTSYHRIQIPNLKRGKYKLSVCGSNNDNVWGPAIELQIIIKPYWYNCTAALVLYVLIGGLLCFALLWLLYGYHKEKRKNEVLAASYSETLVGEADMATEEDSEIEPSTDATSENVDSIFINSLKEKIYENMSNADLSVDDLAEMMHVSRSVLFQKVKESCETTPNNLIKRFRLEKAAELLSERKYKVNEICYMVGFNTPSYFAKCFEKEFGCLPKGYKK